MEMSRACSALVSFEQSLEPVWQALGRREGPPTKSTANAYSQANMCKCDSLSVLDLVYGVRSLLW